MSPVIAAAIAATINAAFDIWRIHANKPSGWEPTVEDWRNMLAEIDASSPEKIKQDAARVVAVPVDVVTHPQEPQAPI